MIVIDGVVDGIEVVIGIDPIICLGDVTVSKAGVVFSDVGTQCPVNP